nr:hypothetical protein [Pseudodesulfovibrio sp.]
MKLDLKKKPKITDLSYAKVQAYYYWWEFLRRSKRYQNVCRIIRERSDNNANPPFPAVCGGISPKNKQLTDLYFDWFYSNFSREELNSVIIEENNMTFYDVISKLYPLFQDTERSRFKHVCWRLKWLYEEADAGELGALFSGYDHLGGFMHLQKHAFIQKYGRKPDVEEYINFFLHQSIESHLDVMLINKNAVSREDLEYIFKNSLKQINFNKKPLNKEGFKYSWAAFLLDGKIMPDSFKMARKAYDLSIKKVPTDQAIIQLFSPKINKPKELKQRYKDLIAQANKLILNAETGNFPGKYSDKPTKISNKRGRYLIMNKNGTTTPISTLSELFYPQKSSN